MGWNTYVNSRQFDRERLGVAYNLDFAISDTMELVADVFYNDMDEGQHGQQLFVNGNFGGRQVFRPYTVGTGQPSVLDSFDTEGLASRDEFRLGFHRLYQWPARRRAVHLPRNPGVEHQPGIAVRQGREDVRLDALGACRCRARSEGAHGCAADGYAVFPDHPGTGGRGRVHRHQSQRHSHHLEYQIWNSLGDDQMNFVIGDELRNLASAPSAWRMHSSWLERNLTETKMDVLRFDGNLAFSDGFSFDFGVRYSEREMNEERADYFSPSGLNGLLAKYQEVGYGINQTSNTAGFDYDPLPRYTLASPEIAGFVTTVSDFGVDGLTTGFPMIDTRALDHPEALRDALYGAGQYIAAPDRTYGVEEAQTSFYFKANFGADLTDTVRMHGNVGVRVVNTNVRVFQNLTDGTQLDPRILAGADPNHTAYTDLGDVYTTTDRTRALPSFNLNFDFGDAMASEDGLLRDAGAATAGEPGPRSHHVLQRRADR